MGRSTSKAMVAEIRYQQAKAIIGYALATKTPANYLPLAKVLGTFSGGTATAEVLGDIMEEDHDNGRPLSCATIVSSKTGRPGNGFFEKAKALGYQFIDTPVGRETFWESQMKLLGML